jgi:hypothetical protein
MTAPIRFISGALRALCPAVCAPFDTTLLTHCRQLGLVKRKTPRGFRGGRRKTGVHRRPPSPLAVTPSCSDSVFSDTDSIHGLMLSSPMGYSLSPPSTPPTPIYNLATLFSPLHQEPQDSDCSSSLSPTHTPPSPQHPSSDTESSPDLPRHQGL